MFAIIILLENENTIILVLDSCVVLVKCCGTLKLKQNRDCLALKCVVWKRQTYQKWTCVRI